MNLKRLLMTCMTYDEEGEWEEAEPEESDEDLLAEEGCLSETLLDLE